MYVLLFSLRNSLGLFFFFRFSIFFRIWLRRCDSAFLWRFLRLWTFFDSSDFIKNYFRTLEFGFILVLHSISLYCLFLFDWWLRSFTLFWWHYCFCRWLVLLASSYRLNLCCCWHQLAIWLSCFFQRCSVFFNWWLFLWRINFLLFCIYFFLLRIFWGNHVLFHSYRGAFSHRLLLHWLNN